MSEKPVDKPEVPEIPTVTDPNATKPTLRECKPFAIHAHVKAKQPWECIVQTAKFAGRGTDQHPGMLHAFEESLEKDIPQYGRFALHQPIMLTVGLVRWNKHREEHQVIVSKKIQELVYHHQSPSEVAGALLDQLPMLVEALKKTHKSRNPDTFEIKLEWFVDVAVADAATIKRGIANLERERATLALMKKRGTAPHRFGKPSDQDSQPAIAAPPKIILEN